jgi:hypothetical protein
VSGGLTSVNEPRRPRESTDARLRFAVVERSAGSPVVTAVPIAATIQILVQELTKALRDQTPAARAARAAPALPTARALGEET